MPASIASTSREGQSAVQESATAMRVRALHRYRKVHTSQPVTRSVGLIPKGPSRGGMHLALTLNLAGCLMHWCQRRGKITAPIGIVRRRPTALPRKEGNVFGDPTPLSRVMDGIHFPSSRVYQVDPVHTFVTFVGQLLVVGRVRGRFAVVAGTITVGDAFIDSAFDLATDPASLTTLNPTRDEHLHSARFLGAVTFP